MSSSGCFLIVDIVVMLTVYDENIGLIADFALLLYRRMFIYSFPLQFRTAQLSSVDGRIPTNKESKRQNGNVRERLAFRVRLLYIAFEHKITMSAFIRAHCWIHFWCNSSWFALSLLYANGFTEVDWSTLVNERSKVKIGIESSRMDKNQSNCDNNASQTCIQLVGFPLYGYRISRTAYFTLCALCRHLIHIKNQNPNLMKWHLPIVGNRMVSTHNGGCTQYSINIKSMANAAVTAI